MIVMRKGGVRVELPKVIEPVKVEPPKPVKAPRRKGKNNPINVAGFAVLDPVREYLLANPNKSAKEISAAFPDIPFCNMKYHLGRAVKFNKLIMTKGYIPTYRAPLKEIQPTSSELFEMVATIA